MPEREPDFMSLPKLTSGIDKLRSLPAGLRNRLIGECLRRSREDAEYFKSQGLTINEFPEGTILPSGNTVITDEKGRKLVRAPIPTYLPHFISNN